MKIIGQCVVF